MGESGNRVVKRTHSLFVDNLKVYQESHNALKIVNETIVQASHDTGACYGVSKCAEIIFQNGKMVRGEGLQVLEERMKTMNPDENEIYKFSGMEQVDGIKTKAVYERVKDEVTKRVKMLTKTELNDANLFKAINMKVIPIEGVRPSYQEGAAGKVHVGKAGKRRTFIFEKRKRRKRIEINERCIQGNEIASGMLNGKVEKRRIKKKMLLCLNQCQQWTRLK